MKKLYLTLAMALLTIAAQAKELTFSMGETQITPESTVYFDDIEIETYDGGMTIIMDPKISLKSDVAANNIIVKAECTSGHTIQLCAGGACEMGASVTKTGVTIGAGEKLPIMFEYMGLDLAPDTEIPTIETNIIAKYEGDNDSMVSFTIVMGKDVNGLAVFETPKSLKCTGRTIEYDLNETTPLTLYSTDGKTALKESLSGNGSLSTSNLRPGIYIYTLGKEKGKLYIH